MIFVIVWSAALALFIGACVVSYFHDKHWPEYFLDPPQRRRYRLTMAARRCRITGQLWSDHEVKREEIKLGIISEPSRHNHESDISCNAGLCAAYESPKGMVTPRPGLTKEQNEALHYQHPMLGCSCQGCQRNHDEFMEATVASYKEAREDEDAYRKGQPGYRCS